MRDRRPIRVPEDAGKEELEEHRVLVEKALNRVTVLAERQANPEPQQKASRKKGQISRRGSLSTIQIRSPFRSPSRPG